MGGHTVGSTPRDAATNPPSVPERRRCVLEVVHMSSAMRSRQGLPLFISEAGSPVPLERASLAMSNHDENWLQGLLFAHPSLLPVAQIEPIFAPLVPLAREVPTAAGPIDLLAISPAGYVTLIETKLWRNAEAKRVVVAQALDYAKEISRWSFEDLDSRVRHARTGHPDGILGALRASGTEPDDDAEFRVHVAHSLRAGRFLILIAGDRIHDGAADLASFVQHHPTLFFTVGLVELEVFHTPTGATLLVPSVLARTSEVLRAVIRIENPGEFPVTVTLPEVTTPQRARVRLTADAFFDDLEARFGTELPQALDTARQLYEFPETVGGDILWQTGSFVARVPAPVEGGRNLQLYSVSRNGGVQTGSLGRALKEAGLPEELAIAFVKDTAELVGLHIHDLPGARSVEHTWPRWNAAASLDRLSPVLDAFLDRVRRFLADVDAAASKIN
jgi:hypothetical protein